MSALSALLARDRIVAPDKLDAALQRQLIHGGDLETNLLEVDAVDEDTLALYAGAVAGVPAARRDEVIDADPGVLAHFDRDLVARHRVIPLRSIEGRVVIAASAPLGPGAKLALEQAAGGPLEVRIAVPPRIAWALGYHYGIAVPPRIERLVKFLDSQAPKLADAPAAVASFVNPAMVLALGAALAEDPQASRSWAPPPPSAVPDAGIDAAVGALDAAHERPEVLDAVLTFATQRFDYAAVFVLRAEIAEGIDARGDGMSADDVRRIAAPLDSPGSFRSVREGGRAVIGPLGAGGTDAVVKGDLGRAHVRGVALLPIHIGGRVVMVVWADQGERPLDLGAVDALSTVCGAAAAALERIIVERKRTNTIAPPAAQSAASVDARAVNRGAIARRVAEQRGLQALRALVSSLTPPPEALAPAVRIPSLRPLVAAPASRIPVAVDVFGPVTDALPDPVILAPPSSDPRRDDAPRDSQPPALEIPALIAQVAQTGVLAEEQAARLVECSDELPALLATHPSRASFVRALRPLRALAGNDEAVIERRLLAVATVAAVRDVEAVPSLIRSLSSAEGAVAMASHDALVTLARHDVGDDPSAWEAWWSVARSRHRVEWLIDAVVDEPGAYRHAAADELERLSGERFDYFYNLPRRDRERTRARYRAWWDSEGRAMLTV